MNIKTKPTFLKGTIIPPASKSYLHRALIAASLADNITEIKNYSLSQDVEDTITILRTLGTDISVGENIIIKPNPWKNKALKMKESGTTYRLMIPLLSVFFQSFELEVDQSLKRRPLTEYETLGLVVDGVKHSFELDHGKFEIDGSVSSQFVSGLLMALPLLDGDSQIEFSHPTSFNYVLMTIEVLKEFGINIKQRGNTFYIKGNQEYRACTYIVEPDFSSIAFWAVAGVINGDIDIKAPKTSLQPDFKIIELLQKIGHIEYKNGYKFKKQVLKPFDVSVMNCPDLAPALAVLGSFINGTSIIRDVDRLIYKESNRLQEILKLNEIGGRINYDENLHIQRASLVSNEIHQTDHRIGMMYAILPISMKIRNIETIDKSYKDFLNDYRKLGGDFDEYN